MSTAINAPQPDHIYHFESLEEVSEMFTKCNFGIVEQIARTANNISLEKAKKKSIQLL